MSHHEASFIPIALSFNSSSIWGSMMVRGLGTVYLSCRGFETGTSHCRQISIMLHKNLTHRISSLSKRRDNLHLWRLLW
jgi:hypothetical protein